MNIVAAKISKKTIFLRILIILIALFIGIGLIINFVSNKQPPKRFDISEIANPVEFINPVKTPFLVKSYGFGTAIPAKSWKAISSVKGNIIYLHNELESGAIIEKGSLLVEIDNTPYRLAVSEIRSELANISSQIAQLKQESKNIDELLSLESERLELAEIDLERTKKLVESGSIAQSKYDNQLRLTLQQRKAVQSLINQKNILPLKLEQLNSQSERAKIRLELAERNVNETKFFAPFDLMISEVKVENFQFINLGQLLVSGDGIDAAEVVLQMPMISLKRILANSTTNGDDFDFSTIKSKVQLVDGSQSWNAEVVRIANGIDPATRTVGVVLKVIQPKENYKPINNPPLVKGMYVEGELAINTSEEKIIIPEYAIRENEIYLIDENNRLRRKKIEIDFVQDGLAIIKSGIELNDKIIISDISPAIAGILLKPSHNKELEDSLRQQALGGQD